MLIISIGWYESGAVGTEQLTPCDLETGGRVFLVLHRLLRLSTKRFIIET